MSKQQTESLGQLASVRRGITYTESVLRENAEDGLPYITMKSFLKNGGYNRKGLKHYAGFYTSADMTKQGDLLIANTDVTRDGDIIGVPALLPDELRNEGVLFSHHVTRLTVNAKLRIEYLYYLLCADEYRRAMKKYSRGTTVLMLDMHGIKRIPICYRVSNAEQIKVVEVLQGIDAVIDKTEALIVKQQQIKAGLMDDLFTCGVLPNGQLRRPQESAPNLYQETSIGWIPKEWGICQIRDCGDVKLGRQRSPDQHSGKWTTSYLRVANVFDGFIDYSDVLSMDFTPHERSVFSVGEGDILLNEGQSLELVGRSAIYRGESGKYCFQNTLVRFRCYPSHSPEFFGHLFQRFLKQGAFQRIAKQTTSVAHLGADRFARMQCPLVGQDEQKRIAKLIEPVARTITAHSIQVEKLRAQKVGLMQDLLTGKVPVSATANTPGVVA